MQMENDGPHDGQKGKLTKVIMPQFYIQSIRHIFEHEFFYLGHWGELRAVRKKNVKFFQS